MAGIIKTLFGKKSPDKDKNKMPAGIGIVFQVGPDRAMYIADLSSGGAAEECRILRKGDCLLAVDGKSVFQCEESFVSNCVLGKFGT